MKTPAPELFRSGRQFAAWIGLTPKDHSTAGKVRPGVMTRAGDEALRATLVAGATSLIRQVQQRGNRNAAPWLIELLKRKPPKLAAVALANKTARIAWKLMLTGEKYSVKSSPAPYPASPKGYGPEDSTDRNRRSAEADGRTCKTGSRWCDRSILDPRHSAPPNGLLL